MPDLIRHPVQFWIPAFAGMTALTYIVAGVYCLTNFRNPRLIIIQNNPFDGGFSAYYTRVRFDGFSA